MFGVIMENDIIGNEDDNLVITYLHRKRNTTANILKKRMNP